MVSRTKKFRGTRTHGRGKKSGRGGGIHGGRGNAGLHKHKFMHMMKYDPLHFGDRYFKRPQKVIVEKRCINLMQLDESIPRLLEEGKATKDGDVIVVKLEAVGVDKLLSKGRLTRKLRIEVGEASQKAREKVEAFGCQLVLGAPAENAGNKDTGGTNG